MADQSTTSERYGKSEGLEVICNDTSMIAGKNSTDTSTPYNYVPAVGDVVEFEYDGSTHEGAVFQDGSLKIWSLFGRPCPTRPNSLTYVTINSRIASNIRKVGKCGILSSHGATESENIALTT